MSRFFQDQGLILKKKNLLKDDKLVTIFSRKKGKITLLAKGIRKITSRRLSHLEIGNLLKFFYYKKDDFNYLKETEIIYNYPLIRKSIEKLNFLFFILFVLNKILPENEKELLIFNQTLEILKKLNNKENFSFDELESYLKEILIIGGFISKEKIKDQEFNLIDFIEKLIHQKIEFPII